MTVDTVGRFERALEGLEVGLERVAAADASERIERIVELPAVGAPLPFDGVSLPDAVTTAPTTADLQAARTGVTPVGFAIAEYGTVAIESTADGAEPIALYPERHVAVVAESDVVPNLSAGFDRLADGFDAGRDSVVFATGRSATADMGDLVHGVHGPGDVHVILLEDR
ncbi:LUD domain-containing protein [Natrinema salaciae]|uniref:L-lactate dehydrogenase complex protein LldG n=1 Tax=Natrinema salaciae TaxID=1186196 RepID=A0A1H9GAC6_9EURY|nr:LUD domain-containing protein [Natrinema salaciae]SEQ47071.1 L-lactate dehydrogenase complex protein LldG [Natrinema salaciae]